MTSTEVPLGAKVQVSAGIGHVRWTGSNAKFAAGKWVGVELLEANGKNDGSVQGERYFDCKPKHGVFVRPSQVQIVEAPTPSRPASARPPGTPSRSRISSAVRQTSPLKESAPATPAAGRGPSSPSSPPSDPRTAPSPQPQTRQPSIQAVKTQVTPAQRPPSVAESASSHRAPTPLREATSPHIRDARAMPPPALPSSRVASPARERPIAQRSISAALSQVSALEDARPATPDEHGSSATFALKRELEELRIKVRILETRRSEDQDRLKAMEAKALEADALRAARVKLQAKFQEQQSSIAANQRSVKDLQAENSQLDNRAAEALDQLEMAALDREVAEEKAEAAEAEVLKLNEKLSELELEVAVLKEENAEYEKPIGDTEGGRSSLAYIQLEKHNERLKEALIRLRDVSSEAERDYKNKLANVEKELSSHEGITDRYELAEAKLANAEAQVDDLKQQLDDALGAEDMLEQLTERNLQMGERIEQMRVTIEDLEALKELNDELEEGHVESEKQLSEEIDKVSVQLRTERARSNEMEAVILDMEATLSQFRDLVSSLQIEIDQLRSVQVSQETETTSTSKEAQALMNLNMKLRSSAAKAQSKTVDFELKRLEASQLAEQTRIITTYLPDSYHESEADSTTLYLFFQRIGSKVDILISTVSSIHSLPSSLQTATSEALVGICELRGKLRQFSILNKRFSGILARCLPDEWVAYGKTLVEVAGVENKVDSWINGIRNEDFNEGECARELSSLIAQFDHLSATVFHRPELEIGEMQLGLAHGFDYDLDNFAAAVGFARQAIVGLAKDEDIAVEVGDSSLEEGVYEPVQRILDLVRAVKVPAGKLVGEVESIVKANNALLPDTTMALDALTTSVSNAVDLAVKLAQRISAHVSSLHSSKAALRLADIEGFLDEVTAESAHANEAPPWELIAMFVQRLHAEIGAILPKVKSATKAGQVVSTDIKPPWMGRVDEIKATASYNADTERKVVSLSEDLKDMLREIKIRDQNLQESGVKVETLERRLEATRKQADQIVDLENDVAKAKRQEKVYEDAIEQLQKDLDLLEAENAKLGKGERQPSTTADLPTHSAIIDHSAVPEQIENLRLAIRYLRRENALLKGKEMYRDLKLLPPLAYSTLTNDVPELDPSSPDSPSSSSDDGHGILVTPTKHSMELQSKLLWQEVSEWTCAPKIVDISQINTRQWTRRKGGPEEQVWAWKEQERALAKRIVNLKAGNMTKRHA